MSPMAVRVPSKKQTLLAFLQRGVAMLHLDARRPGVVVPPQYAHEAHLRLNLSYRYSIADLIVDDGHVQATLSFGGTPFQCQLPWPAIFGITSHESGDGQVWPEDLPVEVMQTLSERNEHDRARGPRRAGAAASRRRQRRAAADGAEALAGTAQAAGRRAAAPPAPGALRRGLQTPSPSERQAFGRGAGCVYVDGDADGHGSRTTVCGTFPSPYPSP